MILDAKLRWITHGKNKREQQPQIQINILTTRTPFLVVNTQQTASL